MADLRFNSLWFGATLTLTLANSQPQPPGQLETSALSSMETGGVLFHTIASNWKREP